MDRQLITSYIDLIRDSHSLGSVFGIYFHDIKDELPSLAYDYSDDLTVCSSVVLKLECGNYVFVSDAKVSPFLSSVDRDGSIGKDGRYPVLERTTTPDGCQKRSTF